MALYFFVVLDVNALMGPGKTEPEVVSATKQSPECLSSIPARAGRTVVQPQPDR